VKNSIFHGGFISTVPSTLKTHTVLNYQEVKALHKQRVLSSPHGSLKRKYNSREEINALMVQNFI
jgi:hypothetical protein